MKEKRGIFRKINNRLTFWFLLVSIIPMIFTVYYLYIEQVRETKQENYKNLEAIRDLKVDQLKNWITERKGDLIITSQGFGLIDLENISNFSEPSNAEEEIIGKARYTLQKYSKNFPDYEELFVLDPATGKVIVSTKQHREGIDKSDDEYYKTQLKTKELFLKDIYYSHDIGDYAMGFSIPIFCHNHKGKHVVGILAARVNLDYSLFDLLQMRTGLGKTGETLIVNKDMLALNRLRWYENAPLKLRIEAAPAIKAVNGETGIIETEDYRGEMVLAAYTHIPETCWGFVCKQDMQELMQPANKFLKEFIILLVLLSFVIVVVSIIIGKAITKPIIQLKNMAKQIELGNYTVRNQINNKDEIGVLAKSVNVMAESIDSQVRIQNDITKISNTLIGNSTQRDFSTKLLNELMGISNSVMGTFYILNEEENKFEHLHSIGANHLLKQSFTASEMVGEFGTTLEAKRIFHFKQIPEDTKFSYITVSGELKPREILTIPILLGDEVVALISLASIYEFSDEFINSLDKSWNTINRTYSNILHLEKTRIMAYNLKRSNEKLAAQTEELQSQSEELQQQTEELQQSSSELQEQNIELEKQQEQVMEATRLKSEFLSNMSHELRTPLNSVLALSEILIQRSKGKLDEEEQNFLEIIERNGRSLLHLINDLLDFSKIEAGKMDIMPNPLYITSVLENIRDILKPLADKKGIEIKLELPEESPLVVTDEVRLHQVLQNIAGNAVKFTEEGYVKISAEVEGDHLQIVIEDTGIGIDGDKLPHIFEEFRQLDGSTSRQYEGTGLGLAIAGKLIKLLHGDIEVKSELGKGTTFSVTIPLRWLGGEDIEVAPLRKVYNKYEGEDEVINSSSKGWLLLVEDNESVVIQMKIVLEKMGYQISVAQNGLEALEFVEHTIPDGIILDLMMPEMDGFEVLENIRSKDETRHLPVLVLTAKDLGKADLARLSANNIQQLVQKGDVDLNGLMYKINVMLKKGSEEKEGIKLSELSKANPLASERQHILIIEDNPDNMLTLQAIIPEKYLIIKAIDGITGLRIAVTQIPDLILLDINLPKMSGIELLGILKKSEATGKIPVIAVTARAGVEDKKEILEAGCDDYLAKPVDAKLLMEKISKWLD
ncbi:MAG: response regulator [Candidatus Stygibacter australis]|nr:response regulator [Candidatus Stygibacter australis]